MIEKNEVLKIASSLDLSPDTVEKDYVLSWILHGINLEPEFQKTWFFKGGTCLKKCYFETYRFSEDLDFTLSSNKHLTKDFLTQKFNKIADNLYSNVGIEFFKEKFKFKIIERPNEKKYVQGKIHYNGPLQRRFGTATIKLDLSTDEIIVLESSRKQVHHPYSDEPSKKIWANCYAFEVRAITFFHGMAIT